MSNKNLIKNRKFRIGHTINTSYGFRTCAEYAEKIGEDIFQIFINSPKSFKTVRNKQDLMYLGKDAEKRNIKILVHGNYMANFCNPSDSSIYKNACRILISELNDSVLLKSIGVVVHMGKNVKKLELTNDQAIDNYVKGLNHCLEKSDKNSILILETGAGQGTEICTDLIDLGKLRDKIDIKFRHRVKYCIDTCHIYSAGYNLGDPKYVQFLDTHIENNLGWEHIEVVHFNDSKCPLNCRKDRHADIGKGYIEFEGLMEFAKLCKKRDVPIVLETPSDNYDDIRYHYTDQIKNIKQYLDKGEIGKDIINSSSGLEKKLNKNLGKVKNEKN